MHLASVSQGIKTVKFFNNLWVQGHILPYRLNFLVPCFFFFNSLWILQPINQPSNPWSPLILSPNQFKGLEKPLESAVCSDSVQILKIETKWNSSGNGQNLCELPNHHWTNGGSWNSKNSGNLVLNQGSWTMGEESTSWYLELTLLLDRKYIPKICSGLPTKLRSKIPLKVLRAWISKNSWKERPRTFKPLELLVIKSTGDFL